MGGDSGGYFLSSATGWDRMPSVFCNIQPNKGGIPGLWAGSEKEFLWTVDNTLRCFARGDITSSISSNIEIALAIKNVESNDINYYVKETHKNTTFFEIEELTFSDSVEDGDYEIYPVCRVNEGEWQKIHFADYAADYVKLNVKNGVKTYTNTSTGGPIGEGVILIDGVYYNINDEEATVTSRNNLYGSYSGDVVIPSTIEYNGEIYPVTHIGMSAFQESTVGTVIIGENVRSMGWYAFRDARVGKIEYVNEMNLTTLEERAFYECYIDELKIPAGVSSLYFLTYSGSSRVLDIPESISYMASQSVGSSPTLKDVYVHWTSEESLPECEVSSMNGISPFDGDFSNVTLHVPEGCIDIYKNNPIWNIFKNITDSLAGVGVIENDSLHSKIRVENGTISIESLPLKESAIVFHINGKMVGKLKSGDSLNLAKGVYIIKVGKESIKIII